MGGTPESVIVPLEEPAKVYSGEWESPRTRPPSMVGNLDLYKSGFDPTVNPDYVIHSTAGIIGELDSMLSRTRANRASERTPYGILDNIDPLAKLGPKR